MNLYQIQIDEIKKLQDEVGVDIVIGSRIPLKLTLKGTKQQVFFAETHLRDWLVAVASTPPGSRHR